MTQQPAFLSAAIDTISAMKLFVHVSTISGTSFSSTLKEVDGDLCPVIQFQGQQAKGTLTRSPMGLTITIFPDPQKASDFFPRTMVFDQKDYGESEIMRANVAQILDGNGEAYATTVAKIIAEAFQEASIIPDNTGTENVFLVGKASDPATSQNIDHLAREVNRLSEGNASCLIAHPALDQPGACHLINDKGQCLEADGEIGEHIDFIGKAIHQLPNAVRIIQKGAAYPLPYRVYPHRFTLEFPTDSSMSATRTLIARAVLSQPEPSNAQFHFALVTLDPTGQFEAAEAAEIAGQQLQLDWRRVMGDEVAPDISAEYSIDDTHATGRLTVRLTMVVEPKSAERYSLAGRYDLVPE